MGNDESNSKPTNPDSENTSNLDHVSEINKPDVLMRNKANTRRMDDLQADAMWDGAIIKQSQTTKNQKNAFDELLNRSAMTPT